jgi:predicted RNA-binding Zn-ribbon protein involved in translation (DUF1610 family)
LTAPKIITLDIETSPIQAFTWGIWQQNIGLSQIIKDWSILSFSAKTLGEKAIRYLDVAGQEDHYDDSAILAAIWQELDEADIVIGQNSRRFDHRKINARLLGLGFPPPSPYKVIDTKVEAAKLGMFTSNKLEWLAAALTDAPKDKHKAFPGFELWRECLAGNPKAWAVMRKYNPKDVIATEKLYLRLRPFIVGHPNVAAYIEGDKIACPKCGSRKIEKRGYAYTQGGRYQRYQCTACGGWARGRFDTHNKEQRAVLLSN